MLDLMAREFQLFGNGFFFFKVHKLNSNMYQGIFTTALPEFKALRDFEWIGYPEMRMDMVQTVLASHKHLHGLGLMYVYCLFFSYTFFFIFLHPIQWLAL